jgi:GT2 family glycosyltransferase
MSSIELSIVTGTVDRPESLYRLIASVQALTTVSYELVIADASTEPIKTEWPNVRVLREWPRQGCVKGYNRAFREALGKWVIWLNDDVEVLPNYDRAAIRFMEENPKVGLGAIYYQEAKLPFHVNQHLGMIYANFGIISRQLGNDVGWFGDELQMYGCDNRLTFEVLLAGYGVVDIPESRVIHHSVPDEIRIENQKNRREDNIKFYQMYKMKYDRIRQVYFHYAPQVTWKTLGPNAICRTEQC